MKRAKQLLLREMEARIAKKRLEWEKEQILLRTDYLDLYHWATMTYKGRTHLFGNPVGRRLLSVSAR
jgi:hypothetical protein